MAEHRRSAARRAFRLERLAAPAIADRERGQRRQRPKRGQRTSRRSGRARSVRACSSSIARESDRCSAARRRPAPTARRRPRSAHRPAEQPRAEPEQQIRPRSQIASRVSALQGTVEQRAASRLRARRGRSPLMPRGSSSAARPLQPRLGRRAAPASSSSSRSRHQARRIGAERRLAWSCATTSAMAWSIANKASKRRPRSRAAHRSAPDDGRRRAFALSDRRRPSPPRPPRDALISASFSRLAA